MNIRSFYVSDGLKIVSRLIGMADRNPFSPTYGCFDRNFWHYKITDYPSGVFQYSVLSLSLAYIHHMPENPWYRKEKMKQLILAGVDFSIRTSHSDGSCDDYYPYERALGAASFSLYAITEALLLLGNTDPTRLRGIEKRADWLLRNDEPYPLANHQMLTANALWNVGILTGEKHFHRAALKRLKKTIQMQTSEGWFMEYEGVDPGYLTYTINHLAEYYHKSKNDSLITVLQKAIEFAWFCIHPDNSFGGEYGSRNNTLALLNGFELIGDQIPLATVFADRYIDGISKQKQTPAEDDRGIFLVGADRLRCYLNYSQKRIPPNQPEIFSRYFPQAKWIIHKDHFLYAIISLAKGGVLKTMSSDGHVSYTDCGFIAKLNDGRIAITQTFGPHDISVDKQISINGHFYGLNRSAHITLSPIILIFSRVFSFALKHNSGLSYWVKKRLTRLLILKKQKIPLRFEKIIEFQNGGSISLIHRIFLEDEKIRVTSLAIGSDFTPIYVAGSRYYQESSFHPWKDFSHLINQLNRERYLEIRESISVQNPL